MPKLPQITSVEPRHFSEFKANAVASAIAHRGAGNTASGHPINTLFYLGQAVRDWFDADPVACAAFVKWYEAQP